MKQDESTFFISLQRLNGELPAIQALIQAQGLKPNRAIYLLNKWGEKGLYEYGVSVLHGWLTPAGAKLAAKMSGAEP